jgi:hypothetical protein
VVEMGSLCAPGHATEALQLRLVLALCECGHHVVGRRVLIVCDSKPSAAHNIAMIMQGE